MQAHLLRYAPDRLFNHRYRYHYLTLMAYQVLVNALKAPAHLQYQLAFLSTVSDLPQNPPRQKSNHLCHDRNSAKFTKAPP